MATTTNWYDEMLTLSYLEPAKRTQVQKYFPFHQEWTYHRLPALYHHDFYFLNLPDDIRLRIYTFLFLEVELSIRGASKNQSRNAPFAKSEVCQILLTCSAIHSEARQLMYAHTMCRIGSVSAMEFFGRHHHIPYVVGGHRYPAHCKMVRKLTIASGGLEQGWKYRYRALFPSLKFLIIDNGILIKLTEALPRDAVHDSMIGRYAMSNKTVTARLWQYIPKANQRTYHVGLTIRLSFKLEDGSNGIEICVVNPDQPGRVRRNYHPIPDSLPTGTLTLPSGSGASTTASTSGGTNMIHPIGQDTEMFNVTGDEHEIIDLTGDD